MAIVKLKINHKLKPKKEPWNQIHQTTDTTQKNRTHIFIIPKSTNSNGGENCVSWWVQVSL